MLAITPVYSLNETQCLNDLNNGTFGKDFKALDNSGRSLKHRNANATAIPYHVCVKECGAEPEGFNWSVFSKQFASWLLPYLALISQLPWGAEHRLDNILSMFLTGAYLLVSIDCFVQLFPQWALRCWQHIP